MITPSGSETLFSNRTPEAAARQLAITLAWLTEFQLEILEDLRKSVRTSRERLRLHEGVCERAVYHCVDLDIEPRGMWGDECPRLRERMDVHELFIKKQKLASE